MTALQILPKSAAIITLLVCIVVPGGVTVAQISPGLYPLDVPVDARTVSMGESFSGVPGDVSAAFYNPAGLGSLTGIHAQYSHRALDWTTSLPDVGYYSASLAFSTSLGGVDILYNRLNLGSYEIANSSGPGTSGTVESHSNLLALAFGRAIGGGFSAGLTVKGFDLQYATASGDPGLSYQSQGSFVLDLGLQYTKQGILGGSILTDAISAGFSLQNFGTDFRSQISVNHTSLPPSEVMKLPRYLRIGFSYSLGMNAADAICLNPFRFLLSGEYRSLLDLPDVFGSGRDYWGWGAEATIFEFVSLRMGGFIDGWGSIYGLKGVPSLRYGCGLAIPFARLGTSLPLILRFDYAAIPLTQSILFAPFQTKTTLQLVTLGITYEENVF